MADLAPVSLRAYRAADRAWVEATHLRHYTQVERFAADFGDAVAAALDALEAVPSDRPRAFLIAEAGGEPVGCVFFAAETTTTGRLRLFYLDDAYRGCGIGRAMLDHVIGTARAAGLDTVLVSTFDRHATACRLYRSMGFEATPHPPRVAFGQTLRQVDFTRDLRAGA